ncbi:hypothetical protein RRG08_048797 [Elysia crispata]|uniref:Uncharacterized protein n=1 Tax=Elysia crispata TaxID=231223 RepID=A0AAE1AN00_9GAST|nr:hypothetical protein RRG08_048797 [Elysia crispata]
MKADVHIQSNEKGHKLRIICTLLYCLPSHRPGYLALQDSSSTSPVSPRTEQGSLHISSATDFCGDASDLLAELHHKQTTLESCHNLSAPEVWSVKAVAPGVLTNFCESFPIHLEKFGSIAFSVVFSVPESLNFSTKIDETVRISPSTDTFLGDLDSA